MTEITSEPWLDVVVLTRFDGDYIMRQECIFKTAMLTDDNLQSIADIINNLIPGDDLSLPLQGFGFELYHEYGESKHVFNGMLSWVEGASNVNTQFTLTKLYIDEHGTNGLCLKLQNNEDIFCANIITRVSEHKFHHMIWTAKEIPFSGYRKTIYSSGVSVELISDFEKEILNLQNAPEQFVELHVGMPDRKIERSECFVQGSCQTIIVSVVDWFCALIKNAMLCESRREVIILIESEPCMGTNTVNAFINTTLMVKDGDESVSGFQPLYCVIVKIDNRIYRAYFGQFPDYSITPEGIEDILNKEGITAKLFNDSIEYIKQYSILDIKNRNI